MKFLIIQTSIIEWKISKRFPSELPLLSRKGLSFLNPAKYLNAYTELNFTRNPLLFKNDLLLTTNGIIFSDKNPSEANFPDLIYLIQDFLKYLKIESLQSAINPNSYVSSMMYADHIKKGTINMRKTPAFGTQAHRFYSAITWNNIVQADKKLSANIETPVYEKILLDCHEALKLYEFDKAILFSAIAIESLLANHYDNAYNMQLKTAKKNNKLRIITTGKAVKHDPILKALKERSDFKKLLHHIPLYLLGKSILQENEPLYANLIKLYTTRNKIVHWGQSLETDEKETIPLNAKGANMAFALALDVFNWVGIKRFEVLRDRKFILLEDGV